MTEPASGEYRDDDRLPWLETVDEDYAEERTGFGRAVLFVLIGLAVIAAVIFGWWWFQHRGGAGGSGDLIRAEQGDYKQKPGDSGGMKVAGDGDTRFVTSDGGISNGSVDVAAVPEEPVRGNTAPKQAPAADKGSAKVVSKVPVKADRVAAKSAMTNKSTVAPDGGGGGAVVQLGSFPSKSRADTAWKRLSDRFGYLAPLGEAVQKAEVNGNTVYRLRVNAGSAGQAKELCGKLKVAGEDCYIP
ncbi:SPOR domain-containing protein [Stakelama sp. CBK3Z-3]|uniref:SPOR domain-containing protein n=1 Tax=Stakelama flava TaxID=2860338 RepID=A0ABS6XHM7_9SPHN|nr:SPOR domain-containing protein [Stakelama flava]MBW4329710.1 SPOR domain-containing protein [Stakelama flava]